MPLTGHLWPLATHHRGHPSGPTGGGEAYGQSGSRTLATPIGRRRYGASPRTGHPGRPHTGRGLHTGPTGEAGLSLAIGLWATGHSPHWPLPSLASHWPLTGHPGRGHWPPTGPHWPHTTGSAGLSLAIGLSPHWPLATPRGGAATGSLPLTGHLWPPPPPLAREADGPP